MLGRRAFRQADEPVFAGTSKGAHALGPMNDFGLPRPRIRKLGEPDYVPAPELWDWTQSTFIIEDAELANPDHSHLSDAYIGCLWAWQEMEKSDRRIVGTAQLGEPTGTVWAVGQRRQQLAEWFGRVPDFLITIDAEYFTDCTEGEACALLEHELYHCAQAADKEGEPRFNHDGDPVWKIRGHDVEEFVGVIERYGAEATYTEAVRRAFERGPKITAAVLRGICGICAKAA